MSVEYTIFCDGCGSIIDANCESVRKARAAAKAEQGAIQRGSKDFCSTECVKALDRLSPNLEEPK